MMTFSIPELTRGSAAAIRWTRRLQLWIFLALFAGFAIKVPLFPLHTWLPLAHVAGADGRQRDPGRRAAEDRHLRLRAVQPADAARRHGRAACPGCCGLSVAGIIYGALVALAQTRHQAADRLFQRQPLGLLHAGPVRPQPAGRRRAACCK